MSALQSLSRRSLQELNAVIDLLSPERKKYIAHLLQQRTIQVKNDKGESEVMQRRIVKVKRRVMTQPVVLPDPSSQVLPRQDM